MQTINLKKFVNLKSLLYILLLVLAYYMGDMDLEKFASKKINLTETTSQRNITSAGEYTVTKVVDGDTVHVVDDTGQEEVVRFLAVDTLEMDTKDEREKCLALMQTNFTKENLLNKKVFLETDKSQGERDKYGRMLAYIGTSSTSTETFNELLLKTGNAKVYRADPPAKEYSKYLGLQTEAQKNNLGMWNNNLCR